MSLANLSILSFHPVRMEESSDRYISESHVPNQGAIPGR